VKHGDRIRQELERLERKVATHRPTPARLAELERLRPRPYRRPAKLCRHCGAPLKVGTQQGRRRYCNDACKMRGFRRRAQGLPESIGEHQGSSLESWHARGDG
jgi:hypothetical protein